MRAADCDRRPPSTTIVVPVTKSAETRYATASATSSGDPIRPSSVSAARRSSWPRLDGDRARRDAADAHLGRQRARQHAGQHRLGRLRGAVRRERGPRLVGGDVLDHHDAAARLAQVRRGGLGHEEAALRGGAEGGVPVGLGQLVDRLGREAFPGRVHEQVEAAELGDRASRRAFAPAPGRRRRRPRARPPCTAQPSRSRRAATAAPTRPVPPVTSALTERVIAGRKFWPLRPSFSAMKITATLTVIAAAALASAASAASPPLTLASSAPTVVYGKSVTLSGVLTPPKANQQITDPRACLRDDQGRQPGPRQDRRERQLLDHRVAGSRHDLPGEPEGDQERPGDGQRQADRQRSSESSAARSRRPLPREPT